MGANAGVERVSGAEDVAPGAQAAIRAARHWVQQLARTIKTCRLYDSLNSPAVQHVRAELANELRRTVETHGTLVLRFTSDDILSEGASLYPARSREDNLALPFYRDGIRSITFTSGVEPAEIDRVIDAILSVTGQRQTDDDLVTLLWEAQFGHVQVEYVPGETEAGGADAIGQGFGGSGSGSFGSSGEGSGSFGSGPAGSGTEGDGTHAAASTSVPGNASRVAKGLPWPQGTEPGEGVEGGEGGDAGAEPGDGAGEASAGEASEGEATASTPEQPVAGRSDDWRVDTETVAAHSAFEELDGGTGPGLEVFRARFEEELNAPTVAAALQLGRIYLAASETDDDRGALTPFLSSVIVLAAMEGEWQQAGTALAQVDACRDGQWSVDSLGQELCSPRVLTSIVTGFDDVEAGRIEEFIAFAHRLGDWAIDLLGPVLITIEGSRHENRLIEAIADECRDCPERLAPWLGDPHVSVVRTTVKILGRIGGDSIAGLLRAVAEHENQAVRDEVFVALRGVSQRLAVPILMGLMDRADTRTFCSIVQRMGQARDKDVAELMHGYVAHPEFGQQGADEQRAIYAALGSSGTDDVLPRLEALLHNQNWLGGGQDAHRQAVARCISQIGTPAARKVLERGAKSRREALRKACAETLGRFGK